MVSKESYLSLLLLDGGLQNLKHGLNATPEGTATTRSCVLPACITSRSTNIIRPRYGKQWVVST